MMQSTIILSILTTMGLAAALPSPSVNGTLVARDTQYTVAGYDGSCIPENQNFFYYGSDPTLAACTKWYGDEAIPVESRSVKFGMPEGYQAKIFSSTDCSVQTIIVDTDQCFTGTIDGGVGAWIVYT